MDNSCPGLFEPDSGWPNTYLLIRGLFAIANAATFTMDTTLRHGRIDVVVYYHSLVKHFGGAAALSILKAAPVTEGWRLTMLWSEKIRYKLRQEARKEGREEQAKEDSAWYERMKATHERGEDFNEPPPWQRR